MRLFFLTTLFLCSSLAAGPLGAEEAKRVLAFGDSNTWGWKAVSTGFPATRHDDDVRWAGVLDAALPDAKVIVDGLVGRRTDIDGRNEIELVEAEDFNGAKALPEAIARHVPLDLVVIMLGTNDLQAGVGRTPTEIAASAFALARLVERSGNPVFTAYEAPKVLVVAPPPMASTLATPLSGLFEEGVAPSKKLGEAFAAEARRTGIAFIDAGSVTSAIGIDGIHMTAESHMALGRALVPIVRQLLADD